MKKAITLILLIAIVLGILYYFSEFRVKGDPFTETGVLNNSGAVPQVAYQNLKVPWEMVLLPDGDLLVTERVGNIRILGNSAKLLPLEGIRQGGEGGLLGLALHPNFKVNNYIYVYYTTEKGGEPINRVVRYALKNGLLSNQKIIIDDLPGSSFHNGGRIAFGPDAFLYITTGDAGNSDAAQDTRSLAGKILRLTDEGGVPTDNPFGNAVYSYGHRNPQGLVWDVTGNLWATEHGRSGALSGYDEINLIERGANYGWPLVQGNETRAGMKAPALHSGPSTTWAPGDIAYHNGKLYFAGLRGQALYEVEIGADNKLGKAKAYFKNEFGRLRALLRTEDGLLYFSTSNRDGRGEVKNNDDKIIKIAL